MSQLLTIQFPDGEAEFSYGATPGVGDRLWRRDQEWIVASVSPGVARCRPYIILRPVAVRRDVSRPEPFTVSSAL